MQKARKGNKKIGTLMVGSLQNLKKLVKCNNNKHIHTHSHTTGTKAKQTKRASTYTNSQQCIRRENIGGKYATQNGTWMNGIKRSGGVLVYIYYYYLTTQDVNCNSINKRKQKHS